MKIQQIVMCVYLVSAILSGIFVITFHKDCKKYGTLGMLASVLLPIINTCLGIIMLMIPIATTIDAVRKHNRGP